MARLSIFVHICILITTYFFVFAIFNGLTHPIPALGDSWDYHIPIAKTILNGTFVSAKGFTRSIWYYPGSSEVFLSLFMLFHIPMTLSNILPALVLFLSCWKLARTYGMKREGSAFFAFLFMTTNVVLRWLNAVSIDLWVGVFFTIVLILLKNPQKSLRYFLVLGTASGMLIGSKYTAVGFLAVLIFLFGRTIKEYLSFKRFIAFAVPFSILGLFWYLRNWIVIGNPFYPLPVLGFPGVEIFGGYRVLTIALRYPIDFFGAAFSEYKIWIFSIGVAIWYLLATLQKKWKPNEPISELFILGLINGLLFLSFPTSPQDWIMVSSFRYSLPVFIPLLLGLCLLFERKFKKMELLGYLIIGTMVVFLSTPYHPKLVLFSLPIGFLFIYIFSRMSQRR